MITEATIERILARLESGTDDYAQEIQDFAEAQPHLMAFLTDEETEVMTEDERALLLFGALVIYQSITGQRTEPAVAPVAVIGAAEEANYQLLPEKGSFRDRLTPLFDASREEDLLAFAEDLLVAEEEGEDTVSKEARAPIFVALKTVVDVLT